MTNGKRNRAVGHKHETTIAEAFRQVGFPHVITSRQGNRLRDSEKVDLVNSNELEQGRFPFNVQCKCTVKSLAYPKLLKELPKVNGVMNVIFHKQTRRAGTRFIESDKFVIMHEKDFMDMVSELQILRAQQLHL